MTQDCAMVMFRTCFPMVKADWVIHATLFVARSELPTTRTASVPISGLTRFPFPVPPDACQKRAGVAFTSLRGTATEVGAVAVGGKLAFFGGEDFGKEGSGQGG
jgi:hypothetical protein